MADWIANAEIKKGALHRALGIPEGEKIPQSALDRAQRSKDPHVRKMAQLAETLKGLNHGSKRKREG
jgi:hypothetical protein